MEQMYHNRFYAMGTRMNIVLPGVDEQTGMKIFTRCKHETGRIERKISHFDPHSDLSRLNKAAYEKTALIDEEFFDILMACKEAWRVTNGAFDPAASISDSDKYPSGGMETVILNPEKRTVKFTSEKTRINLGGFGKGYALEKIRDYLLAISLPSAFISFGGSSVLAVGDHPAGGPWKIGIQDYLNPRKSVYEFATSNRSVSTSGNFYADDDGNLIAHTHIINPKTGHLETGKKTMSVQAESPLLAEILSTALLVADETEIPGVLAQYNNVQALKAEYTEEGKTVSEYTSNEWITT